MTAEEQAIQDIKDELRSQSKCFLAFRKRLNPIIDHIVEEYIKKQNDEK